MQRYEEFEFDDYAVVEPEEEPPSGAGWDLPDEMLLRLHQCSIPNRMGIPDQGFPKLHRVMEAKGLLTKQGKGWMITTEGREVIRAQRHRLRKI